MESVEVVEAVEISPIVKIREEFILSHSPSLQNKNFS